MPNSFVLLGNPGKKISLDHQTHPCPRCKHQASVQLMRSENQWIVLNKRVSDNTRVRYECSQCHWKNEELPYDTSADLQRYLSDDKDSYYYSSSANTSPSTSTHGSTYY